MLYSQVRNLQFTWTRTTKCVQAVGTAMRCNPVSLVVPCHRVVRAGQGAGHYSGGTRDHLKVWLLQHEKCSSSI